MVSKEVVLDKHKCVPSCFLMSLSRSYVYSITPASLSLASYHVLRCSLHRMKEELVLGNLYHAPQDMITLEYSAIDWQMDNVISMTLRQIY